jgi:hypothetical protein
LPKVVANVGTSLGTDSAAQYTVGANDPALYRNVLVETLTPATAGADLPEAPAALLLPLGGLGAAAGVVLTVRRRRRTRLG